MTIGVTLIAATTPGLSGPGSNGNERVLNILDWRSSIRLFRLISRSLVEGGEVLLFCRNAIYIFYSPSQLGCCNYSFPTACDTCTLKSDVIFI